MASKITDSLTVYIYIYMYIIHYIGYCSLQITYQLTAKQVCTCVLYCNHVSGKSVQLMATRAWRNSGYAWSPLRDITCHMRCSGTKIRLSLRPANERRRYKVTPSLIGWAQSYNKPGAFLAAKISRPRRNGRHFTAEIFACMSFKFRHFYSINCIWNSRENVNSLDPFATY